MNGAMAWASSRTLIGLPATPSKPAAAYSAISSAAESLAVRRNGWRRLVRAGAHPARPALRLKPVHVRHHDVHQDDVERSSSRRCRWPRVIPRRTERQPQCRTCRAGGRGDAAVLSLSSTQSTCLPAQTGSSSRSAVAVSTLDGALDQQGQAEVRPPRGAPAVQA